MKQTMNTVYCMQCDSLVSIDNAAVAFRTGFYRVSIPLGQCSACAVKMAAMEREACGEPFRLPLMA